MDLRLEGTPFTDARMQFYIFVMFLGLFGDNHEENPSFLDDKNSWLRMDGWTDGPMDGWTNGRTEM